MSMSLEKHAYNHLIILILQFLHEEEYKESVHSLEKEAKVFFNTHYFEQTIINGEWEKAEDYLSAFTRMDDNRYSMKLFFELRKQKYYEALDRNDHAEAVNILWKDLKVFSKRHDKIYYELAELFSLKNIRENEQLSGYIDATSARAKLCVDLKIVLERNPILRDKLVLPKLNKSAFFSLISLFCPNPEKTDRSVKEELIYLILQFLDEEKFMETLYNLEKETKIFFNMNYFGEFITNGEWDEAEKYLSAFIKLDDNRNSVALFFEMRRQKYLEALNRNDDVEVVNVLWNDLTDFAVFHDEILNDLARVFLCNSFRENRDHSDYMDTVSTRANLCDTLKMLVKKNPVLQDTYKFPSMDKSRLITLVKQMMDRWVPYRVNMMPDANTTISLENIPKVPYLCHGTSPVTNISNKEGRVLPVSTVHDSRDSSCLADVNSSVQKNSTDKAVIWKLTEINEPSECRTCLLPENCTVMFPDYSYTGRVCRLVYSCNGGFILALAENATHKHWRWLCPQHWSGKRHDIVEPLFIISKTMTNERGMHAANAFPCFALKDSYLFSSSGGKISIFSLDTYETVATFANPPPTTTYFAFFPRNMFAIGFDDSSIVVYCIHTRQIKAKLNGHQKQITCLAFSHKLNVLVSSGADAQLCVWSARGWEKLASKTLRSLSTGEVLDPPNHIQFHRDQIELLVVHERQIDKYGAPMLNHLMQWVPQESDLPITHATYSCDGQSVYVSFKNGCIKVLDTPTLNTKCRINITAYAKPNMSLDFYPLVIAAHPSEPNQIALGLTNSRVIILEPLFEREWGVPHPSEDVGRL